MNNKNIPMKSIKQTYKQTDKFSPPNNYLVQSDFYSLV